MAVVRARSSPPYGAFVGFFLFGVATIAAIGCYFLYAKAADEMSSLRNGSDSSKAALVKAQSEKTELEAKILELTKQRDLANDQYTRAKGTNTEFQTQADTARKASEESAKSLAAAKDNFTKESGNLSAQIAKLNADIAKANADRAATIKQAQESLQDQQAKAEENVRNLRLELDQTKSELATKDKEVRELRTRVGLLGGPKGTPTAGEADSTIVRVNQATGEATIMLGKKDHVVPGMTFTAYDPRLGVRYGTDEAAQGNGSIEVMDVGETTSQCRITHVTPNRAIQTGDLVANIVYHSDRTRQFRFVVRGDFDLDGDGVSTAAERERLERLITSWGGKVDQTVTSQTDYVVIGETPRSVASIEEAKPETAPATAPEAGSVADQRQKDQADYEDVIAQAQRLSIPVLNKNRFLAMIGYYNTTIVRYGAAK